MRKALLSLMLVGAAAALAPSQTLAAPSLVARPAVDATNAPIRVGHYYRGYRGTYHRRPADRYYYAPRTYYRAPAYYAAPPVVYYPPPVVVYYPPPVIYRAYPPVDTYRYRDPYRYGTPAAYDDGYSNW